jgi:hypothetical protein
LLESRLGASVIGGGFGLSLQQASFGVGLKGVAAGTEHAEAVSDLILATLKGVVEVGLAPTPNPYPKPHNPNPTPNPNPNPNPNANPNPNPNPNPDPNPNPHPTPEPQL